MVLSGKNSHFPGWRFSEVTESAQCLTLTESTHWKLLLFPFLIFLPTLLFLPIMTPALPGSHWDTRQQLCPSDRCSRAQLWGMSQTTCLRHKQLPKFLNKLWKINAIIFIEVELICSIVLVSSVQQRDSVTYVHVGVGVLVPQSCPLLAIPRTIAR